MRSRTLGKTGKQVSELGFGCWAIGGTGYGPVNDSDSLSALNFAYDNGITFYDTADVYGNGKSEQLVAQAFEGSSKRLKIFLASKVGWDFYHGGTKRNYTPEYIRFACGESLRRLKTDYLDLYQLHNPDLKTFQDPKIWDTLELLKKEGKILHYGASIHMMDEGKAVVKMGKAETIQTIVNLIDQRPLDDLFPETDKNNIGIIAREPLACGLLTGKYSKESTFHKMDHRNSWSREKLETDLYKVDLICNAFNTKRVLLKQAAVEFVLSLPSVSTVIPGMKTVQHVREHLNAVLNPSLSPKEISKIREIYKQEAIFQTGFYR